MLSADSRKWIEKMVAEGGRPHWELPLPEARARFRARATMTSPLTPALGTVRDHHISGNPHVLAIREYAPAAGADLRGGLLFFHGGGWTFGDLDSYDGLCGILCAGSGCSVFSVDYRLAPEHPFPSAYEDALAAWNWLVANASSLGVDSSRMAVGGDSSGGNIAAALALATRSASPRPAFQMLFYPVLDAPGRYPSYESNATGCGLTTASMHWYWKNYVPDEAHMSDWRAVPMAATDLARLPPTLLLTARYDPLADEGAAYADLIAEAGVEVSHLCFPRQNHGFLTMGQIVPEGNDAARLCAAALAIRLS